MTTEFSGYEVVLLGGNGAATVVTHSAANQILGAILDKNGISCFIIHHLFDQLLNDLESAVTEVLRCIGPDTKFIGMSSTLLMTTRTTKPKPGEVSGIGDRFFGVCGEEAIASFIARIKAIHPHVKWVIGGPQVTQDSIMIRLQNFDYACLGQGEEMILALYQHLSKNTKLPGIQAGNVFVLNDKDLPYTKFAESDHTPPPGQVLIPGLPYFMEVARGCIFKCSYCHYQLNGKSFGDFTRSIKMIRDNLIHNYEKHGIQLYYLTDDTIVDSKEKMEMLREVFKDLPFEVYWGGYHRLDLFYNRPEWVADIYAAGCRGAFFGIETLHNKAGSIIGKGLGRDKVMSTLALFRKHAPDLHLFGAFIMGLSQEPIESLTETTNIVKTSGLLDSCKYFVLKVANSVRSGLEWSKLSKMEANPEKYNLRIDNHAQTFWPLDGAFKSPRHCKDFVANSQQDFRNAHGAYKNRTAWFGHVSHLTVLVGSGKCENPIEAFKYMHKVLYPMPAREATVLLTKLSVKFKKRYWSLLREVDHTQTIKLCNKTVPDVPSIFPTISIKAI